MSPRATGVTVMSRACVTQVSHAVAATGLALAQPGASV